MNTVNEIEPTETTVKVKMECEVEVPVKDWIEFLTQNNDIFMSNYCGYWMRGVDQDDEYGWLVWEHDDVSKRGMEPDLDEATKLWKTNQPLPQGWFRLNRDLAIAAYKEGVKRWGVEWFDEGDAGRYDVCIQLAMLGEVRYG